MTIEPGMRAEVLIMVERSDTAIKMGSGDVPVLGTPRLLAVAEATTMRAVHGHLAPGQTSVGTKVTLEHRAASPVGTHVEVSAELVEVDGRRLVFEVVARDRVRTVATATIERVIVDRDRFLSGLTR
ncbi:thioesterase family protein [Sphaerisporangium flaviroseum]|uniref:Thioesterase family protein n=1 Tax=Sphaerisporangium flaviroseum TaxID=509199 RepID=A0ABP7JGG3_9ACTN